MKKLLGIVVLGLLWCTSSISAVTYTCYDKPSAFVYLDDWSKSYSLRFEAIRVTFSESGSILIEEASHTYRTTKKNEQGKLITVPEYEDIWKQFTSSMDKDNATELINNMNPIKNGEIEFKPWKKKFYQLGEAAGGIVQTFKELSASSLKNPEGVQSYEFWELDINKKTLKRLGQFTDEYVYMWNKNWGEKEEAANFKKISNEPFEYDFLINCEESEMQSDEKGGSGTAFFINNRGNLITNNHVVEGCELSKINYFNKEYDTNLISTDKTLDLALLKVDLKPKDFISFSNKEPRKRQTIIIAGYPLGEYLSDDLKINEGKISSLKGFENNSNEITVDLAINPGNSGGPIVDENGQLVAVAVAGMSKEVTEGISFGIKSSAVTNFLKTNKISPDIKLTSFSMNDEKVNQLLEESTVYIFCE